MSMSISERDLKNIWVEEYLFAKSSDGSLKFNGATQNYVEKSFLNHRRSGFSHSDVMEVAVEQALNAIFRFKPSKGWDSVVAGDRDENFKLWKYINLTLFHQLKYLDPLIKREYDAKTNSSTIIKTTVLSLDEMIVGTDTPLKEILTEENLLVAPTSPTNNLALHEWFVKISPEILSKKQLEFINGYREGNFSDRNGYLPRIKKRLEPYLPTNFSDFQEVKESSSAIRAVISPKIPRKNNGMKQLEN